MSKVVAFLSLLFWAIGGHAQQSIIISNKAVIKDSLQLHGKWYSSIPDAVSGTGGPDTSAVHHADTSGMLAPYLKTVLGVKYGDTASMLAGYMRLGIALRLADTSGMLSAYLRSALGVKYSDTASMLAGYMRLGIALRLSDTSGMLSPYLRSALGVKYSDTSAMLTSYLRKALGVKYVDTAAMLAGYLRSALGMKYSDTASAIVTVTRLLDSLSQVDDIYTARPLYWTYGLGDTLRVKNDSAAWNAKALLGILVNPATPSDGQSLVFDQASNTWKAKAITGGISDTATASASGLETSIDKAKLTHPLVVLNTSTSGADTVLYAVGDTLKAKSTSTGSGLKHVVTQGNIETDVDFPVFDSRYAPFGSTGTSMTNPMTAIGDLIVGGAGGAATRFSGNSTASLQFLSQTGNGSASALPVWHSLVKGDVGLGNVENTTLSTWPGSSNLTTFGTVVTGVWHGTPIATTYGGIPVGGTANQVLAKASNLNYDLAWVTPSSGFADPMTSAGDLIARNGSNVTARLPGNTSTTMQVLSSTGTGSASALPVWRTLVKGDIGLGNVENTALSTWAGSPNLTSLGTIATGVWHGSAIGTAYGGIPVGGSANQVLTKATGSSYDLVWTTPSSGFADPMSSVGDLIARDGSNVTTRLPGNTTTTLQFLTSLGNGSASALPVWHTVTPSDFPTLNQNTTGTASSITGNISESQVTGLASDLSSKMSDPMTSIGDIIARDGSNVTTRLPGNTTTTLQFLTSLGNGSASALPVWHTFTPSDFPTLNQNTTGTASSITGNISESQVTGLASDLSGKMSNPMTTLGDLMYGGSLGAPSRLPGNSTTSLMILSQTGTGSSAAAPAWHTLTQSDVGLGNLSNVTLSSGQWTPTVVLGSNVTAGTANACTYLRVGNVVTISGSITVTATSATSASSFTITPPIASNFTSYTNATGTVDANSGLGSNAPNNMIANVTTHNTITINFCTASSFGGMIIFFSGQYIIQ